MCTIQYLRKELDSVFECNSERKLLKLIQQNTILLCSLYYRKYSPQPVFSEIPFGSDYRCDYLWLNDNSDGPEWTIVEVEKPRMPLFTNIGDPRNGLNHALEQLKHWRLFFDKNQDLKRNLFRSVGRFRWILVAGSKEEWTKTQAAEWRTDYNRKNDIEIRSSNVFYEALDIINQDSHVLNCFIENGPAGGLKQLKEFVDKSDYLKKWENILQ